MAVLTEFLFRLSFGLALAMAATSSRQVTSGFFRVHCYVLLGLNALATMVALGAPERFHWWPPVTAALLSYAAAVAWLYERPRPGKLLLMAIAAMSLTGAYLAAAPTSDRPQAAAFLACLDPVSGGLVLGTTFAAMLLGHWYLNTPTMQLGPLRRLVAMMVGAVAMRAGVCGAGLALASATGGAPDTAQGLFLALRWLSGIVGATIVAWMTWQTLKVPNTQSATGILYVGVIATFLGELTSLLLSAQSLYPL